MLAKSCNFTSFVSVTTLSLLLFGCTPPTTDTSTGAVSDSPEIETELEVTDVGELDFETAEVIEKVIPTPWEHLQNYTVGSTVPTLLLAANSLVQQQRITEAQDILGLVPDTLLEPPHSIDHILITVQIDQLDGEHAKVIKVLGALSSPDIPLTAEQQFKTFRMAATSFAVLGEFINCAKELIKLQNLLAEDSEKLEVANQIWSLLNKVSLEELSLALSDSKDPVAKGWFNLALVTNVLIHDPYNHRLAVEDWQNYNHNHPANLLLQTGLLPDNPILEASVQKIALLMPNASPNADAANAFVAGFSAQHAVDSNPNKPLVEVEYIGSDPNLVTLNYSLAVEGGADYIVGPIGVKQVNTLAKSDQITSPTILLGQADNVILPDFVVQFSLAPEQEGAGIAKKAASAGDEYALILHPPTRWAMRVLEGFVEQWEHSGGQVVDKIEYGLNESDYSQMTQSLLNVDASAKRYGIIRSLAGRSLKFIPRRRQDVDVVVLIADADHGRLIKPHLDFLKAHNLPIYSTWRIYDGYPNPINDNDLNSIQFADMPWLVDDSPILRKLRKQLKTPWRKSNQLDRLFAMGIDSYNLLYRAVPLRRTDGARYHGVTSILQIDGNGRIQREPAFAKFVEGAPQLIPDSYMSEVQRFTHQLTPPTVPELQEQR